MWLCTGGMSHCDEMSDDVVENTDVSLVSGKLRCTGTRLIDSDTRDHRDAIIKRNEQMIIANNSASMYTM